MTPYRKASDGREFDHLCGLMRTTTFANAPKQQATKVPNGHGNAEKPNHLEQLPQERTQRITTVQPTNSYVAPSDFLMDMGERDDKKNGIEDRWEKLNDLGRDLLEHPPEGTEPPTSQSALGFQDTSQISPSPVPASPYSPSTAQSEGPIVRMTLDTYDALNKKITSLGDEVKHMRRVQQDQQSTIKKLTGLKGIEHSQDMNILSHNGVPQNGASHNGDSYNGVAIAVHSALDLSPEEEAERIKDLRSRLAAAKALENRVQQLVQESKAWKAKVMQGEQEIQDLKRQIVRCEQRSMQRESQVHTLENKLAEQDALQHKQVQDHVERNKGLPFTTMQREKKLADLETKLTTEQSKNKMLAIQLQQAQQEASSTATRVSELEAQLRAKTSESSRFREDLRNANKTLDVKTKLLQKSSDEKELLRGAAHLVVPKTDTRLPKIVFACIECFNRNLQCDHGTICQNCKDTSSKCARWRCSVYHRFGDCPDKVCCALKHSAEGWLVAMQERPQW